VFNESVMPDPFPSPEPDYGQTIAPGAPARPPAGGAPPAAGSDYGATIVAAGGVVPGASRPPPGAGYGSGGGGRFAGGGSAFGTAFGDGGPAWTVLCELGRGGMGVVQLVHEPGLQRHSVVKRINADLAHDPAIVDRFLAEARAAARLLNYHIVHVHRIDEDVDGPLILMEYVPGPYPPAEGRDWPAGAPNPPLDLEGLVKREGKPLAVQQAVRIVRDVCSGVGVAHKAGVVHRDIKPANILLTSDLEPKLADFGLARHDAHVGADAGLTMPGARMLTMGYGAPEQEVEAGAVDARADLYALGATLYFAVTGQNPRHFRESDVPEPVRAVVVKAMTKDRERRYQTVKELTDALDGVLNRLAGGRGAAGASTAEPAAAGTLAPGVCYACGHQHGPADAARKYCAACGEPLQVPCLSCKSLNPIWTRFCGQCRDDTVTAVERRAAAYRSAQAKFPDPLLTDFFLDEAKDLTDDMLATVDPRLKEFREWARAEQAGPIPAREADAKSLLDAAIARATALESQQRYVEARDSLSVPESLRVRTDDPTVARLGGDAAGAVGARLRRKIAQVDHVATAIREGIQADRWVELVTQVDELQSLQRAHPLVDQGRTFIARREVENEAQSFSAAMHATRPDLPRQYLHFHEKRPDLTGPRRAQVWHHYLATLRTTAMAEGDKAGDLQQEYVSVRTPEQRSADVTRGRQLMLAAAAVYAVGFAVLPSYMLGGRFGGVGFGLVLGPVVGLVVAGRQMNGLPSPKPGAKRTGPLSNPVLPACGFALIVMVCCAYFGGRWYESFAWGAGLIAAVASLGIPALRVMSGKGEAVAAAYLPRPTGVQLMRVLRFRMS
jgi:serine/threonine protein kinase